MSTKLVRKRRECIGCGKHMLENTTTDWASFSEAVTQWGALPQNERDNKNYPRSRDHATPNGTYGYSGNGYFCTLSCGFRAATAHARKNWPNYAPEVTS